MAKHLVSAATLAKTTAVAAFLWMLSTPVAAESECYAGVCGWLGEHECICIDSSDCGICLSGELYPCGSEKCGEYICWV
jgi:hypothetical protein